ncbi:pentatricopeptide repeat-containing protein ELI1, chloroplastic-like [Bidens hawaiensis]|uniref:pentatricopeptide repeat-containing protein ELI1, chloroplastic-like n=1 Tax=Bidens hawaiensis TaxID=980011 RepID=UPI004048F07F
MLSPSISTTPPPTTTHHPPHSPETLISLLTTTKTTTHLLQIHAAAIRHHHHTHPLINFKLQRSYSTHNHINKSITLFNLTPNPNVFFYTNIIHSHSVHNLHLQKTHLYTQMLSNNINPNEHTFSSLLMGCGLYTGKQLHTHVIKMGFTNNIHVSTGLVNLYAKNGDLVYARQVFDKMPERSLVSLTAMVTGYAKHGELVRARALFDAMTDRDSVCWNVMIGTYAKYGKPVDALALFREMLSVEMRPDEVTLVAGLSACGQIGAVESGRWIHSYMRNNGIRMNVHLGTALIDMYSKCGSLKDAELVFSSLKNKDIIAYNAMITAYAMHGLSQEALVLFSNMCNMHTRLTNVSFVGILNACAHSGLVSIGKGIFLSIKRKHKTEPKIEHYGCIVNLLGRAGYLEQAYEVVTNMNIDPDPVIWGTLLDSCTLHKNVDLAERIVKFLVDRNLANSGTYILLSNLYAATSDWDGVARMRSMMKDHGVEKEPGCSSIEVDNKVHEFVAGDMKHPKSDKIYMMLEEVSGWLKDHGYVPQTDVALHDFGTRERARSLEVHSEKLAIAFGLISTKAGSDVKIVKNLRICLDCHEVMKLISKITGRRIIVRDRNRFHLFEDGSCSCGDYW